MTNCGVKDPSLRQDENENKSILMQNSEKNDDNSKMAVEEKNCQRKGKQDAPLDCKVWASLQKR